jgi:hypothetical protein
MMNTDIQNVLHQANQSNETTEKLEPKTNFIFPKFDDLIASLSKDYYEHIKTILFSVLVLLIVSEVFEFIRLKGFDNPIAYSLFKLVTYTFSVALIKNESSVVQMINNNLKLLNENMRTKLEEINSTQTKIGMRLKQIIIK